MKTTIKIEIPAGSTEVQIKNSAIGQILEHRTPQGYKYETLPLDQDWKIQRINKKSVTLCPVSQRKQATFEQKVFEYILNAIDGENYGVELSTDADKIEFVYKCFVSEYWYSDNKRRYKNNEIEAFKNWLTGLPSSINIEYRNFQILEIAKVWGTFPQKKTARGQQAAEDKIIANWFNLIAVKFFILKRRLIK